MVRGSTGKSASGRNLPSADRSAVSDGAEAVVGRKFEAGFRELFKPLVKWLVASGAQEALAADAVQHAFVVALPNWDSIENPRAWLYKAARREYFKLSAKQARALPYAEPHQLDTAAPSAEDDYVTIEERHEIANILAKLPLRQREVMTGYALGLRAVEIAQQLNISDGAVRESARKARTKLRAMVGNSSRRI